VNLPRLTISLSFPLAVGGYNELLNRCFILDPEGKGADRVEVDTLFIAINMTGPKVDKWIGHLYSPSL